MVSLSCGYYHTAVVSADGDLYAWGEAEGGKLGLAGAPAGDTDYPRQVQLQLQQLDRQTTVATLRFFLFITQYPSR